MNGSKAFKSYHWFDERTNSCHRFHPVLSSWQKCFVEGRHLSLQLPDPLRFQCRFCHGWSTCGIPTVQQADGQLPLTIPTNGIKTTKVNLSSCQAMRSQKLFLHGSVTFSLSVAFSFTISVLSHTGVSANPPIANNPQPFENLLV